jgi:hypothetical protein
MRRADAIRPYGVATPDNLPLQVQLVSLLVAIRDTTRAHHRSIL